MEVGTLPPGAGVENEECVYCFEDVDDIVKTAPLEAEIIANLRDLHGCSGCHCVHKGPYGASEGFIGRLHFRGVHHRDRERPAHLGNLNFKTTVLQRDLNLDWRGHDRR